ncbi:MAG: hypothetical protein OHK0052_11710 [Anaerolineales bacterium]
MTAEPFFASLASLRAAHHELLRSRRQTGETPALLEAAVGFVQRGVASGGLLHSEKERAAAQSLLDYWANILYNSGKILSESTLAAYQPDLAPALPDEACPYLGLQPFDEKQRHLFFGRQSLVEAMLTTLQRERLLLVVGASGSGKSSATLAGVVAKLLEQDDETLSEVRYLGRFVPGGRPLQNLALTLVRLQDPQATRDSSGVQAIFEHLRSDPRYLLQLVERLGNGKPTLLVVDQFEETFTLGAPPDEQRLFGECLHYLSNNHSETQHFVAITLRADFEGQLLRLPELYQRLQNSTVRVTAMSAAELRQAIINPAELVGLKFEDGLVDELVRSMVGEPAALPLLQFTLLKLWQARARNRITWQAYRDLGGGRQALARSADQIYNSLIPEEQITMRRILLRLVRPGEGLEITSGRVPESVLYQRSEASDRIARVLNRLIDENLLRRTPGTTADETTIEVAHEALVRNWPLLVEWLEEERSRLRRRLQLTNAAEQWQALGRSTAALWRGPLLEETQHYDDLTALEAAFVRASIESEQDEARAIELARQRELEQTQQLAAEQKRRAELQTQATRRLTTLIGLLFVGTLFALGAAFYAFQQRNSAIKSAELAAAYAQQAEDARKEAESLRDRSAAQTLMAGAAFNDAESNRLLAEKALLEAEQARQIAESALQKAKENQATVELLSRQANAQVLATSSNAVRRSDPQLSLLLALYAVTTSGAPDSNLSAEANQALLEAIQAAQAAQISYILPLRPQAIAQTANSRLLLNDEGTFLAEIFNSRLPGVLPVITVWELSEGKNAGGFTLPFEASFEVSALSPDGRLLALAVANVIEVRRVSDGNLERQLVYDPKTTLTALAFSPSGERIAAASGTGQVLVWDLLNGQRVLALGENGDRNRIFNLSYSTDGNSLLTLGRNGNLKLWDALRGVIKQPLEIAGDPGSALATAALTSAHLALSPDGSLVALSTSNELIIRIWNSADGKILHTLAARSNEPVAWLTFDPRSALLAVVYPAGVEIWNMQSGEKVLELVEPSGAAFGARFDESSSFLRVFSGYGLVRTWLISAPQARSIDATTLSFSELYALGKALLARPLTPEECLEYLQVGICPPLP